MGWLFRFILINYCNVDVFHYYLTLCANLYYLSVATLSVVTLETFSRLPNWSDIFKYLWTLIKYYQKDKMIMGPSSGFYGDASSINRKNVCSMDNAGSSNNNTYNNTSNAKNTTSDKGSTEESDSGT